MIELYSIHPFLFKNVVISGPGWMAYFSTDFRLKIFLYLFLNIQLYYISAILPVSIIVRAGFFVLLASFAVRLEKGGKIQKYIIVLYLQVFNTQNYILFKISAWGLFLKYRKFQPRYPYKIYSYKRECIICITV